MSLGLIQPLTEMNTRSIPGGKGGRCVGLTTLPPSCSDCLEIWEPETPGTLKTCSYFSCKGGNSNITLVSDGVYKFSRKRDAASNF
jgi:hypothetical protein